MKSLRDEIRLAAEEEDGFNFIPKRKLKSPPIPEHKYGNSRNVHTAIQKY